MFARIHAGPLLSHQRPHGSRKPPRAARGPVSASRRGLRGPGAMAGRAKLPVTSDLEPEWRRISGDAARGAPTRAGKGSCRALPHPSPHRRTHAGREGEGNRRKLRRLTTAKKLREEDPKKWTQQKVAEALGMGRETVRDWLGDTTNGETAKGSKPDARVKVRPAAKKAAAGNSGQETEEETSFGFSPKRTGRRGGTGTGPIQATKEGEISDSGGTRFPTERVGNSGVQGRTPETPRAGVQHPGPAARSLTTWRSSYAAGGGCVSPSMKAWIDARGHRTSFLPCRHGCGSLPNSVSRQTVRTPIDSILAT